MNSVYNTDPPPSAWLKVELSKPSLDNFHLLKSVITGPITINLAVILNNKDDNKQDL